MPIEILSVTPKPFDRVEIEFADGSTVTTPTGEVIDGVALTIEIPRVQTATGWLSAITNHVDPADPQRVARPMTAGEARAYAVAQVYEQYPQLKPVPAASTVPFTRSAAASAIAADIAAKTAAIKKA